MISLGVALAVGAVVYGVAVTLLRIPEADRIRSLLRRREAEPPEPAALEEDAGMQASLTIQSGGGRAGDSFPLELERTTIGRSPESDVFLDDVTVSRRHAIVVETDEGYYIDDLDSRNGTFVNRMRIESHWIADGDEIQVGRYKLIFREPPVEDAPQD